MTKSELKKLTVSELAAFLRSNIPELNDFAQQILDELIERAWMYEDLCD